LFSQNKIDENGQKQGYWTKSDKKGNRLYEGQFKDNYEIDTFKYYYEDGKTIKMINVFSSKGKNIFNEIFNNDGQLISRGYYKNKKRDSIWTYFSSEGYKIGEERYRNGLKNGESNFWDRDTTLVETINYKDDLKDGLYYRNTYAKGYYFYTYKNNKRNGPYEDFYYYNKIKIKGHYVDDKKEGEFLYFDSIGDIVKKQKWENDVLLSEEVLLDIIGNKRMVPSKDIAYFYQKGKQLSLTLFSGETILCVNNIDNLLDLLTENELILLNNKLKLYANINAIKGVGEKQGEFYEIILSPKPNIKIFSDKESTKAIETIFLLPATPATGF
jgi:antitoxin component YwqK of YwqJK toxin-antitoxin module